MARILKGFSVAGLALAACLALASCGKKAEEVASLEDVQALEEAADEAGSLAGASVNVDEYLAGRARNCFGIDPGVLAARLGAKQAEWKPVNDPTDWPGCVLVSPAGAEITRIFVGEARVIGAAEGEPVAARLASRQFVGLVAGAAAGGSNPAAPMRSESPGVDIGGAILPLPIYIAGFTPASAAVTVNQIGISVGDFFVLVTFPDGTALDTARAATLELVYPAVQAVHDGQTPE